MKADGKKILKKRFGKTNDIIDEVFKAFSDSYKQCIELNDELRCNSEIATCRKIYDYAIKHVRYEEDPDGEQWVKTPARLIADGVGDCKSIAIFCASCLTCLGIPAMFRFVSFIPNSRNVSHVYVVTESGIIIDPVEQMVNGGDKFNYASNFYYKKDLKTTQIYRLSGVGATADPYKVWYDGTVFIENTLGRNFLLAEINCKLAYLNIFPNDLKLIQSCDIVTTAYRLYLATTGNAEKLANAGYVLQAMKDSGMFDECKSTDDEERAENLQRLIAYALSIVDSDVIEETTGELQEWFKTNIAEKDYTASEEIKENYYNALVKKTGVSGIGDLSNGTLNALSENVYKSGFAFTYMLLPSDAKQAYKDVYVDIDRRLTYENIIYSDWKLNLADLGITNVKSMLLTGIANEIGTTPYGVVLAMENKQNGTNIKIGALEASVVAAIITAVSTLISVVSRVVIDVVKLVAEVKQKKALITEQDAENASPKYKDFSQDDLANILNANNGNNTDNTNDNNDNNDNNTNEFFSNNKNIMLLGAGLLALFALNK